MDQTQTERFRGHLIRLGALALVLGIVPAVLGGLDLAVTPEFAIATHVTMLMLGVLLMCLALAWRGFGLADSRQHIAFGCIVIGGFFVLWTGTLAGVLGVGGETLSAFAADATGNALAEWWVRGLLGGSGVFVLVGLWIIARGNAAVIPRQLAAFKPPWWDAQDRLFRHGFALMLLAVFLAELSAWGLRLLGVVAHATVAITALIFMALGRARPEVMGSLERVIAELQEKAPKDGRFADQLRDWADRRDEVSKQWKVIPRWLWRGVGLNVAAGVIARFAKLDHEPLAVVSAGWTSTLLRAYDDLSWSPSTWLPDIPSVVKLLAVGALFFNSVGAIKVAHGVYRALPGTGAEATMPVRLANRLLRFGTLALAVGFLTAWLPELSRVPRVGVGTYATLLIIGPMFICFALIWREKDRVRLTERRQKFVVSSLSLGALGVVVAGMILALFGIGGRTLSISAAGAIGSDRAELFAKIFVDAAIALVAVGMILFWIAVRPQTRTLEHRIVWACSLVFVAMALQFAFYFAYLKVRAGSGYPVRLPDFGYMLDRADSATLDVAENQNWTPDDRQWFYHTSQGGAFEVPVPYDWIMALEQPTVSVWPFEVSMLMDTVYLQRFGFLPNPDRSYDPEGLSINQGYIARFLDGRNSTTYSTEVVNNPDKLPVGFARTEGWIDQSTGRMIDAMGFTCAACHTSQIDYVDPRGDTLASLRIDGGPANVDLGKFRRAVSISLGLTRLQPWRFDRFADRLKIEEVGDRRRLREELDSLVTRIGRVRTLQDTLEIYPTEEGFGRLDAFGRIFNFVFGSDLGIDDNLEVANAPVNFPYLWDAPRFDWVQYNASFQQPMIRNLGQSMGVFASLDLHGAGKPVPAADDPSLFASSIRILDVHEMELLLGGCTLASDSVPIGPLVACRNRPFEGLKSPRWPKEALPIDTAAERAGRALYSAHCAACHLPGDTAELASDRSAWTTRGRNSFLKLELITLDRIGTDPLASRNFATRQVELGDLAARLGRPYRMRGADALPLLIDSVLARRYRDYGVPRPLQRILEGHREPDTQVFLGYRARPLNGVWATAPFLHNGSVPTLYHLLSPQAERPDTFYLGSRIFDPKCVGFDYSGRRMSDRDAVGLDCRRTQGSMGDVRQTVDPGYFRFDTSLPGNSNLGHSFEGSKDDWRGRHGVLGPELTRSERMAIIEYLKTLDPLPVRPRAPQE